MGKKTYVTFPVILCRVHSDLVGKKAVGKFSFLVILHLCAVFYSLEEEVNLCNLYSSGKIKEDQCFPSSKHI